MTQARPSRPLPRSILALAAALTIVSACVASGPGAPATVSTAPPPATSARAVVPTASSTPRPATRPSPSLAPGSASGTATAAATLAQMVGQRLVIRMDGSTPDAGLLQRIQRGEIGGVILFADDISSPAQLRALTSELHRAASNAGQPRLLVMTDQEGGAIRRIPWAPPSMSARAMGADGRTSTARTQGRLTGAALHDLGVDVDLAPVADIPATTSSFLYLQRRTFSFDPATTSRLANAFALGLRDGGAVATMKHFPGLGRAKLNTDERVVRILAGVPAMQQDLAPYRAAIANHIPLIMVSNAIYSAWDPVNGAGWSRAITRDLLRVQLGFKGVTITDSLSGAAKARGVTVARLAVKAAVAGTDLILVTGSEASTASVYNALLANATSGVIPGSRLRASYARILALKAAAP